MAKGSHSTESKPHPLDGVEEWDCYDQLISERNKLITAKKESEDGFTKTIIQLSSAIVLAVPSVFLLKDGSTREPSLLFTLGMICTGTALLFSLTEQFLSSFAYRAQIKKTDAYYTKKTSDISPPEISKYVQASLTLAFLTFVVGVGAISVSLLIGPWEDQMAQSPTPTPRPVPSPSPIPRPMHDTPGRSVPPTPPPAPPSTPRL